MTEKVKGGFRWVDDWEFKLESGFKYIQVGEWMIGKWGVEYGFS